VHQGCYKTVEADVRAFPFKAAAANDMTVEACRQVSLALQQDTQPAQLHLLRPTMAHYIHWYWY
jgi:hypothetical protein